VIGLRYYASLSRIKTGRGIGISVSAVARAERKGDRGFAAGSSVARDLGGPHHLR
jgi:hypothetical protein